VVPTAPVAEMEDEVIGDDDLPDVTQYVHNLIFSPFGQSIRC
jgi:hypothetical protein